MMETEQYHFQLKKADILNQDHDHVQKIKGQTITNKEEGDGNCPYIKILNLPNKVHVL